MLLQLILNLFQFPADDDVVVNAPISVVVVAVVVNIPILHLVLRIICTVEYMV